jgi:hypothetical protein
LGEVDQNTILNSWNDWIRQIGIECSMVGIIGLGGSEYNIK